MMRALRAAVYRSLSEIPCEAWEALRSPSFYLSYPWLAARNATILSETGFVMTWAADGRALVAFPFYVITRQSYRAYDPIEVLLEQRWLREVQATASPDDLKLIRGLGPELEGKRERFYPSLVVAAPGRSGGVRYAHGLDPGSAEAALAVAVEAMEASTGQPGGLCAWLHVPEGADPTLERWLARRGFRSVVMGAECHLPLPWASFDGYLDHFTSQRRRGIKMEIRRAEGAGVRVELCGAEALGGEIAPLEVQWRAKYGRRIEREEIEAQHREIQAHLAEATRVFVARYQGRAVGFTVFFESEGRWYSRFGGFDESAGQLFLYFSLVFYAPIREAIHRGITSIHYSMESYEAKRSRGCHLRNLLAIVRLGAEETPAIVAGLQALDRVQRRRFERVVASHGKPGERAS
jgi:predicted N-acyltransferase